ncbi:unnamed protein product [Ceratitis capitata]|uniref:(Mediterranean fruit fly) hypothetical protein n=1 Tax=Ceratitis capitata TaxID=7213 RepID=W8BQ05_CERCA|nr:unnamed protein product [Ceratitis capitata]
MQEQRSHTCILKNNNNLAGIYIHSCNQIKHILLAQAITNSSSNHRPKRKTRLVGAKKVGKKKNKSNNNSMAHIHAYICNVRLYVFVCEEQKRGRPNRLAIQTHCCSDA